MALCHVLTCPSKLMIRIGSGTKSEELYSKYLMLIFKFSNHCDYCILLIGCRTVLLCIRYNCRWIFQ